MTSRENVARALTFSGPEWLPHDFPAPFGTDFAFTGMNPSPDDRPSQGVDEWGAVWENIGVSRLGEVKEFPLQNWADFARLPIPDVRDKRRFDALRQARENAGDKFLVAHGISIYERVHFLRGLENTWMDIYDAPEQLCRLLDLLVEMNLFAIDEYARAGVDAVISCDDWGLQDKLMISPAKWRELWKPRYARIYAAAHQAGMHTFLHSCGNILDILDDLIEIGLDAIHMDQQENMGLEVLGERFGGRINFFATVDIQNTLARGNPEEIRRYCRRMVECLARPEGGFIPRWYEDPVGAGHTREAVEAMCDEFLKISAAAAARGGVPNQAPKLL